MSTASASAFPLSPPESDLLRRLAVCVDGCSLKMAAALAANAPVATPGSALWGQAPDHPPPPPPSATLVATLHGLAMRGLLLSEAGPAGAVRYRLPDEVRVRAAAELAATGALVDARRAHAAYCLAFAEAIDRRVWTAEYPYWMERLESEWANLQAALAWAAEADEPDLGLRLTTALWLFWQTRGRLNEGSAWLGRFLARVTLPERTRAAGLTVAGFLAWFRDDLAPAATMLDEAAARWRELDIPQGIGRALFARALVAWRQGDVGRLVALLDEALGLFRATNDLARPPLCLIVQAIVARGMGEPERALVLLEEAIGLAEHGGFAWGAAAARYYEGEIRADRGDYAGAAVAYLASVATSWALRDPWTTGAGIGSLATIAALRGEAEAAARLFGAAHALCGASGAFLPAMDWDTHARVVAEVRARLGKERFAAAAAAGASLTPEAAIAEAAALPRKGPNPGGAEALGTPACNGLTPREREVLRLLVQGLTTKAIALELGIGVSGVNFHVAALHRKFGVNSRPAAVAYALRHGLA